MLNRAPALHQPGSQQSTDVYRLFGEAQTKDAQTGDVHTMARAPVGGKGMCSSAQQFQRAAVRLRAVRCALEFHHAGSNSNVLLM